MSDDQTLEELVQQREMSSSIDLPQLNRAIHRQAVLIVRWCILFHRLNGVVEVDPDNEPPTYAISVDDRGLDYALRWLPPELIRSDAPRTRRVHLADLDKYLAEQTNSDASPMGG